MTDRSTTRVLPAALLAVLVGAPVITLGVQAATAQPASAQPTEFSQQPPATLVDFRGGREMRGRRGRHGGMMLRVLAQADANNDGSVTQEEVDTFRAAQVTSADADSDGSVSLDEFQTIYLEQTRPMMVDAFQALDADGDGEVTTAELDERFGSIVERLDRNDDGALSAEDRGRRGDRRGRGRDQN